VPHSCLGRIHKNYGGKLLTSHQISINVALCDVFIGMGWVLAFCNPKTLVLGRPEYGKWEGSILPAENFGIRDLIVRHILVLGLASCMMINGKQFVRLDKATEQAVHHVELHRDIS